ncbi:hypothetical protein tpqmel_0513 [Candidatus Gastranaerophilus sp. (ex Termes propinquus)]|nr:hypothetical protein tpqmel_0513 [Candidatus Gastranaerophilus sp. (ex Termes propinquus)]
MIQTSMAAITGGKYGATNSLPNSVRISATAPAINTSSMVVTTTEAIKPRGTYGANILPGMENKVQTAAKKVAAEMKEQPKQGWLSKAGNTIKNFFVQNGKLTTKGKVGLAAAAVLAVGTTVAAVAANKNKEGQKLDMAA